MKVVPKASRTELAGWMGDVLKIRVQEPPERGKANDAVVSLVTQALGISRERVRVVSGATSARKILEIVGLDGTTVRERLS